MAKLIIIPLCSFFLFFCLLSHQTMSQPQHMSTFCNPLKSFTRTSLYETNRNILLSSLSITSTLGTYSNATIGLNPDTVHGMFLCRGDISTTSCSNCVETAALEVATNCTLNKEAIIYYQECMVRYSDFSFFSDLEIRPNIVEFFTPLAPNSNRFNQTLSDKFDQLIRNASLSSPIPYFVGDQERVTQSEGSYDLVSMVQCSPDLDPLNCTICLRFAFVRVSTCCGLRSWSLIFTPKCVLGYVTSVLSSPPPPPSSPLSPPPLFPPSPPSPPPLLLPPQLPTQPPPPPLVFVPPQNIPSRSGSFSVNAINGNEIFGRIVVTVTALVFALVDM